MHDAAVGRFEFNSGRLCLDFTNTVRGRPLSDRTELINHYGDLVSWARQATIITPGEAAFLNEEAARRPRPASEALSHALAVREAIHGLFSARARDRWRQNLRVLAWHLRGRPEQDGLRRAVGAGEQVLHGQWSSPVAANVNGRIQVLFGGGDGWLRSYDAASGHEVWRFDGNPKDARWLPWPGAFSRGSIIASPVFADGRVFVAMGQSPGHGNGPSLIHAISPNGQGNVTDSRLLWTSREVGRVVGTPIASDGLLYIGDLGGTIYCLDAATGELVWKHETDEAIWGSLLLAGDRLYVGNVVGTMTVLRAGRHKQLLGQIEMDAPLYSAPALVGDALYLATAKRLYLIAPGS